MNRPMTMKGNLNRPVTGIGGLKTGYGGSNARVYQDKNFFIGEFKQRITLITQEIEKLNADVELMSKEEDNYMNYEKRADDITKDVNKLQDELGDYNTMFEAIQKDRDIDDLVKDSEALNVKNDLLQSAVNEAFVESQKNENMLKDINRLIEEENMKINQLISTLGDDLKSEYDNLRNKQGDDEKELLKLQKQTDDLKNKYQQLAMKKAIEILVKIELAKQAISNEEQSTLRSQVESIDANKEKEMLLNQEDNVEISTMERKIQELQESITKFKNVLQQQQDFDDSQNYSAEKREKIQDLIKRDSEIQSFLNVYDAKKSNLELRIYESEKNISRITESIKNITEDLYPALDQEQFDLTSLKKELKLMEPEELQRELVKTREQKRLVEQEIAKLHESGEKMKKELETFENIEDAKRKIEETNKRNIENREVLKKTRKDVKQKLDNILATLREKEKIEESVDDMDNSYEIDNLMNMVNSYHQKLAKKAEKMNISNSAIKVA
ncbi:hypothetical protein O9G_003996 [Rozella allomycis CSF55]|uniref:Uncharacterized protein n=1 Tax=Rozella allomycis (strain CSF55) TaxID=988480 RepID=A0A075B027_ROZAC|nr:hypothetical protein O9G_003996 [Rozella allomycis CSF55]|eukprot:EPZ35943.1 hypothetical protein O9G_003996 [Rozella allomycis CSF55]